MSATSYLDVELDEGIFDRVNSEYTKEFDAYVKKVDQLLSTDLTFNKFGGESNYANLVSWTATYNINNDKSAAEAAMIRQAVHRLDGPYFNISTYLSISIYDDLFCCDRHNQTRTTVTIRQRQEPSRRHSYLSLVHSELSAHPQNYYFILFYPPPGT